MCITTASSLQCWGPYSHALEVMNWKRQFKISPWWWNSLCHPTLQTLKIIQLEVNSLVSVELQNQCALDTLPAQQGGACAIIGGKCCLYVNQTGQIESFISIKRND